VAAGNSGQEAPEHEDDLGYLNGRIHAAGRIAATGLTADMEWIVLGSGAFDISENELEVWYPSSDRLGVSVQPPGLPWTKVVRPGFKVENRPLPDGSLFSVYNELYHPTNGCNYISVYLSPYFSEPGVRPVRAGTWRIRLHGLEVRDGRYDAWIERDDFRPAHGTYFALPSIFSAESNSDRSSVSSLACGHNVIAVANLDPARHRIHASSSQGPTRDGRSKPEIAAPGTGIVAAAGFSPADRRWVRMTGTSMASPLVAGVVGLMLSKQREMTAAQILGILRRAARPLPGHAYDWRDDAGYGQIDPRAALAETPTIFARKDAP
jgi:subtilisin family serine protease